MEIFNPILNITQLFALDSLQTNPEVMRNKAVVVQSKINQMKNSFDSLEYAVSRTKMYWIGEAGDAYRESVKSRKSDIDTILLRLSEHVADLNEMAVVYEGVEQEVEEIANDLPVDVIY